jgi:hypothetical protein
MIVEDCCHPSFRGFERMEEQFGVSAKNKFDLKKFPAICICAPILI